MTVNHKTYGVMNNVTCISNLSSVKLGILRAKKQVMKKIGKVSIVGDCSLLGVYSLIGNIVGVNPQTDDKNLLSEFGEELEKIK